MMETNNCLRQDSRTSRPLQPLAWNKTDLFILITLAAIALMLFLPGLGALGLIDPSEAYYAEAGREMLEKHQWITPILNYCPWYEKPALTFWLIILSYKTFGVSEFAARLPSALLGTTLVLATYTLSRNFLRRRSALLAALILATSPLPLIVGHLSLTDMPFSTCLSVALLSFLGLIIRPSRSFFLLAYIALGLAALAKGPLALVLTGLIVAGFLATDGSPWREKFATLQQLRPLEGLLVAAAVAAPWYIAVCLATNGAFAQEFFIRQNFVRATGTLNHNFPPWFYIPYLFGGTGTWSLFLFAALPAFPLCWQRPAARASRRSVLLKYAIIWSGLIFLLLSLIPSKLPTYILPVCPALALLLGTLCDTMLRLNKGKLLTWTGPALTVISIAALIMLPSLLRLAPQLLPSFWVGSALFAGCTVLYTIALFNRKPVAALSTLIAGSILGTAILVPLGMQAFYCHHERGLRQIIETVRSSGASVGLAGPIQSSIFYYLRRHVPIIDNASDLQTFVSTARPPHLLILNKGHLDPLITRSMKVLEHHRSWCLVSLDDK